MATDKKISAMGSKTAAEVPDTAYLPLVDPALPLDEQNIRMLISELKLLMAPAVELKEYIALITVTSDSAATVSIIKNTIGTISLTVGATQVTLSSAALFANTVCLSNAAGSAPLIITGGYASALSTIDISYSNPNGSQPGYPFDLSVHLIQAA